MIRAPILLIPLLVVAACSIGVQADIVTYKECNESIFDAPLERTYPTDYGLVLVYVDEGKLVQYEIVTISAKTDDSRSQKEEPKNVIVVHADKSIDIDTIGVLKKQQSWPYLILPIFIDTVCQDSAKQLLVIKLRGEIEDKSELKVVFTGTTPIRDDHKGLHKEGDTIKASFANSEARLSIPCFDDPKYKTVFQIGLVTDEKFVASSETCSIQKQDVKFGKRMVQFADTQPISFDELSFELKPESK